jgi:hypothetical protein
MWSNSRASSQFKILLFFFFHPTQPTLTPPTIQISLFSSISISSQPILSVLFPSVVDWRTSPVSNFLVASRGKLFLKDSWINLFLLFSPPTHIEQLHYHLVLANLSCTLWPCPGWPFLSWLTFLVLAVLSCPRSPFLSSLYFLVLADLVPGDLTSQIHIWKQLKPENLYQNGE